MLVAVRSSRFKRDVRKLEKQGKDLTKLRSVLLLLLEEKPLPDHYRDHVLRGDWYGFRDLHVEPDWLLLYRVKDGELQLARTGSHSELFRA
jgi:mRNA interferase YafQ